MLLRIILMQQLSKRQPDAYISEVLCAFNSQKITLNEAMEQLEVSRAVLYRLRTKWLASGKKWIPSVSGGTRGKPYPKRIVTYIKAALDAQKKVKPYKPNFTFISDELARQFGFQKSHTAIQRYAQKWFPELAAIPPRKARGYRRWQKERAGALWQHDSTTHEIGPEQLKAYMILTIDDATRQIIGISIVPKETLDEHFTHFRKAFKYYGIPEGVYTDGFTMFGHEGEDIKTRCGRMLKALGIAHIIAKTPQAKGKVERAIGTFERRLLAVFMQHKVTTFAHANELTTEIVTWWNENHVNRTIELKPNEANDIAKIERKCAYREPIESLIDLFAAKHYKRRVANDCTIEFGGKTYQLPPTDRKSVYVVHHLGIQFWVVETEPDPMNPKWPTILGHFELT